MANDPFHFVIVLPGKFSSAGMYLSERNTWVSPFGEVPFAKFDTRAEAEARLAKLSEHARAVAQVITCRLFQGKRDA
jgi:hypothetical protein